MVRLSLIISLFAASAVAAPAANVLPRLDTVEGLVSGNSQGRHGGFYYNFWSDYYAAGNNEVGPILYRNLEAGRYSVQWNNGSGNFVAGKGWNHTDADRVKSVTYSGTFSASGTSYLSFYGVMATNRDNLNAEYYIVDNWIKYNPTAGATKVGTIETDGSVYDIHIAHRFAQGLGPSWRTIYSVRREKRTGGTITVEKHLEAWKALDQPLVRHFYSILAVEGYHSTGEADMTVLDFKSA